MVEYVKGFVVKFANDWVFNLAAMLAYNLMMSLFPIILALLSIAGFVIHDHAQQAHLIQQVSGVLPPGAHWNDTLTHMLQTARKNAGVFFAASMVGFLWIGGNLFGAMENTFSIIYRIKGRDLVRQKLMCVGMITIFAVLVPVMIAASSLMAVGTQVAGGHASPLLRLLPRWLHHLAPLVGLLGPLSGFVAAFILFFIIYLIVPNVVINPHLAWRGSLVAAALLEATNLIFPYYVGRFINTAEYGDTLSFAVVLMIWFWFFGVILLLGAEINSYTLGQRALPNDLAGCIHDVQKARDTRAGERPFHQAHDLRLKRASTSPLLRHAERLLAARAPEAPPAAPGAASGSRAGASHDNTRRP